MQKTLEEILSEKAETDYLDFKQEFDPNAPGDWLELIKDIVAISNSGGGHILIGCLDNGDAVGVPSTLLKEMDPAVMADKIAKYTSIQLSGLSTRCCEICSRSVCAISIPAAEYPMPFIKVGNYRVSEKKQKTAFGMGTLYFRHSAKSEPANADDIRKFVDRRIASVKEFWLSGIKQVVEAPSESVVAVLPSEVRLSDDAGSLPVKITHDMAARILQAPMLDQTHPFRQKEVIREFNHRLKGEIQINQHHLLCVRRAYNVQRDLKYCYNMEWSSPRYSEAFIDWLVEKYREDSSFFALAKQTADELRKQRKRGSRTE